VSGGGSSSSTLEKHVESDKKSDHQPQAKLEKLQMQKGNDESPAHENAALATPIDWAISWDTETIFPEREIGEGQTKTLFDLERRPMTSEPVKIRSINDENHFTHEEFAEVDFKRGNEAWLAMKASGKFKPVVSRFNSVDPFLVKTDRRAEHVCSPVMLIETGNDRMKALFSIQPQVCHSCLTSRISFSFFTFSSKLPSGDTHCANMTEICDFVSPTTMISSGYFRANTISSSNKQRTTLDIDCMVIA
jgi:hypothetical protein